MRLVRTSLSKALKDVIDRKHDQVACKQNCKANGKVFNHDPLPCQYFNDDDKYIEILVKLDMADFDFPDTSLVTNEKDVVQIADFRLRIHELEKMNIEIKLGCRKVEDISHFSKDYIQHM